MSRHMLFAGHFLALALFLGTLQADDQQSNPTGRWKWTPAESSQGKTNREVVLKLKLDGDKLTGTLLSRGVEYQIEESTFNAGVVSFKITRERDGNVTVNTYKGKVEGDTIRGTIDAGMGEPIVWEARRVKE